MTKTQLIHQTIGPSTVECIGTTLYREVDPTTNDALTEKLQEVVDSMIRRLDHLRIR